MDECNHVWKVPLYGSSDMLRCEKCGKDVCGYEIANDLERQLSTLRVAVSSLYCFNPITGKRDGKYCVWEGEGKCRNCTAADRALKEQDK